MSHLSGNPCSFSSVVGTIPDACSYALTREFHLKDHLGNVRVVFNTSGILSENHYYPFGLPIHNLSTSTAPAGKENRYLYNGKELQDDLGLNWMDYGARFYDAGLGRWHSVDPLGEQYRRWSPYTYCVNNPIRFIDPDGMRVDEYELNKESGEIKHVAESPNDVVHVVDDSGKRTGEKVEFEGKPITKFKNRGESKEGKPRQMISVSNSSDGNKLFNFIKEQTGERQEWSIINFTENNGSPQSLITTSGTRDSDYDGGVITRQRAGDSNIKILTAEHNHPIRDTSHISSEGDQSVRDAVLQNNPEAKVIIHYKEGGRKWTSRSINNDTKQFNDGKF